jgi:iron-sulfur cluster repair protein YtfE (RIC family)
MKNHIPIKRHPALVSLSRDHHFGLLLVWKIKQGLAKHIALERIRDYVVYFFENDLDQHFREEEQTLFPKLPINNALRIRAEQEHAFIYKLVERLRTEEVKDTLLREFADRLMDHIRFEERELFALLQETLTDAELEMVAAHGNSQADLHWADPFWLANQD